MTSFSIRNFGCRVNQAEAFDWTAELQQLGWRLEDDPSPGGIVVVNTCTLTSRADRDARKLIRKISRENPGARIVVTGCLAEREPDSLKAVEGVWRIFPNAAKSELAARLAAEIGPGPGAEKTAPSMSFRRRALVKIQDGCDMTCSFCIIPSVRGRSASRHPEDSLVRIADLASAGFKEIVLAGIHLCSYGRDLQPPSSLLALLRAIDGLPGEFRVRLSSLDPRLLPDSLLDYLGASPRISPHFHLSFQHGSDRILAAMGRGSTASEYRGLAAALADRSPDANIGADFIVGFPGETKDDFRATVDLLEETPLHYAHVFSYSARPGTKAAETKARPLEAAVVTDRADRLREIARVKNLAYRRRFVGRELDGIVIQRKGRGVEVLTPNYLEVLVPETGVDVGAAVRIRILKAGDRSTTGEICDNNPQRT
jgi:threonylcarbamoyladenosine tRNA methylthiotransferase MtaB